MSCAFQELKTQRAQMTQKKFRGGRLRMRTGKPRLGEERGVGFALLGAGSRPLRVGGVDVGGEDFVGERAVEIPELENEQGDVGAGPAFQSSVGRGLER